jgi:hypothetical protein
MFAKQVFTFFLTLYKNFFFTSKQLYLIVQIETIYFSNIAILDLDLYSQEIDIYYVAGVTYLYSVLKGPRFAVNRE